MQRHPAEAQMVSGLLVVTIPLLDGVMVLRKVDERSQVGSNVGKKLFLWSGGRGGVLGV